MADLKQQAAVVALNKMMAGGHFNVCTVREIAEMFGVMPDPEPMGVLKTLHCVDFNKMPRELYASLPALIQAALSGAKAFQFDLRVGPEMPMLPMVIDQPRRGLLRRIFSND